jgi:hypothetical protein
MGKVLIAYRNHRTAAYRQPLLATDRLHLAGMRLIFLPIPDPHPGVFAGRN